MNFINKIKDKIAQYINVNLDVLKLNAIAYMARVLGYFAFSIICMFLVFAILLYLGFGLTEWFTMLADGSRIAGLFMTVGAYILLILVIFALRKSIVRMFANAIVRVLTDDEEEK